MPKNSSPGLGSLRFSPIFLSEVFYKKYSELKNKLLHRNVKIYSVNSKPITKIEEQRVIANKLAKDWKLNFKIMQKKTEKEGKTMRWVK